MLTAGYSDTAAMFDLLSPTPIIGSLVLKDFTGYELRPTVKLEQSLLKDWKQGLTRLGIEGVELIDRAPRHGAEGPVAFLHPRSCHGVLVELIEAPGGPAWRSLGFTSA